MAAAMQQVLEQALALPCHDRLHLAGRILASVEPVATAEIEAAWEQQIETRIKTVDEGRAAGRPWSEIAEEFDRRHTQ